MTMQTIINPEFVIVTNGELILACKHQSDCAEIYTKVFDKFRGVRICSAGDYDNGIAISLVPRGE